MGVSGILQLGFWLCSWGPVLSSALLPQECSFLSTLLRALRSFSCLYFKQMEGRARARSKSWGWGIMGIKGGYQGDFKRQDAREGWHSEIWCQNKERGTKQATQKSNGSRPLQNSFWNVWYCKCNQAVFIRVPLCCCRMSGLDMNTKQCEDFFNEWYNFYNFINLYFEISFLKFSPCFYSKSSFSYLCLLWINISIWYRAQCVVSRRFWIGWYLHMRELFGE